MALTSRWLCFWLLSVSWVAWTATTLAADVPVDFNRDIRPILSNRCLKCHGPDGDERQAGLRFDSREGVLAKLDSGKTAVVAGKPEESELIRRVASDDDDVRMPPKGKRVPVEQVALLKQWIDEGLVWEEGFAFKKPAYEPPLKPRKPRASLVVTASSR